MSDNYDSPWKDVLERYFPEFMAFFFPTAYQEIDWSKGYESLDQELQQVVREADSGKRFADKLMKVWRHDGEELYVVIHIEVQGQHDTKFPLRMFIYNRTQRRSTHLGYATHTAAFTHSGTAAFHPSRLHRLGYASAAPVEVS